ncbi:MAG: DUF5069 domain-containing protein [Candidatus Eremiobacteraeota bacterium]|nr:DUF5069 domain-containing protein [Candidatus Eremiobacteraeota bacterium]
MHALDLTKHAPRSPWEKLDGLYLMPRTIDKLRAQLPGGACGEYVTEIGLSQLLLKMLRVEEEALRRTVAEADSDQDVAAWLRTHTDAARYEKISAILSGLTAADVTPDLKEPFARFYAGRDADLVNIFDILDWDDRRSFAVSESPGTAKQTA